MADTLVKKKRRSMPKVRTGCRTCKFRRVKCDEARPACNRCQRLGVDCGGYEILSPTTRLEHGTQVDFGLSLFSPPPRRDLLKNDNEKRYFGEFTDLAVHLLTGCVDKELWTRIVMQAANDDKFVRHTVVAIGASSTELVAANPHVPDSSEMGLIRKDRKVFALQQYNKAVKHMLKTYADSGQTPSARSVVLSCLLVAVFESIHGDYKSAATQVQTGIKLIDEEEQRAAQSSPGNSRHSGDIEEELREIFDRLEFIFAMICTLSSPSDVWHQLARGETRLRDMPTVFLSFLEGRRYLSLISRQALLYQKATAPYSLPSIGALHLGVHWVITGDEAEYEAAKRPGHHDDTLGTPGAIKGLKVLPTPPADNENMKRRLHERLSLWREAFKPLERDIKHNYRPGDQQYYAMIALKLHYLTTLLGFSHAEHANRPLPSYSVDIFKKILAIAREQLQSTHFDDPANSPSAFSNSSRSSTSSRELARREGRFSFESMNLVPLFMVARRCPDMKLRREAVSLLRNYPRKKWIWDSVFSAQVADCLIDIEGSTMSEISSLLQDSNVYGPKLSYDALLEQAYVQKVEVIYCPKLKEAQIRTLQPMLPMAERIKTRTIYW